MQAITSRRRLLTSAAALVCLLGCSDAPRKPATIAGRMAAMECPGALVGVFPDDGEPTLTAYGVADLRSQEPMRLDMRMRIGSVSKLFVGAAILRLVDRGLLSLDDPVSKYRPDIPAGERITLRMLGDHTSGLYCPIHSREFQRRVMEDPKKLWTPDELIAFAVKEGPFSSPGAGWNYSNTGAVLLGAIAQQVTGKPFAQVVDEEVLTPLGLSSTGFCDAPAPPAPTSSGYRFGNEGRWIGYGDVFFDVTGYSASWSGVAGDMYSTLQDLGKAAKPIATGSLLSEASRKELRHWRRTTWGDLEYGFLINRNRFGVGHEGNVPGFAAVVRHQPEKKRSVVVLTNLSNAADGATPDEELLEVLDSVDTSP